MRSANSGAAGDSRSAPAHTRVLSAIDLLGQRWTLRIIWELEPGPLGFLQLRRSMGNCSSSMLSNRLQQLQEAGLVQKNGPKGAYELTVSGIKLSDALQPLWNWSETWSSAPEADSGILPRE
ncbi:winged helix-turn-helix transcriptional regulator [Nocardia shimofusensis]|uniref:winged helix-turn-helix transcriptional regulator n=1 Tax=Nocardia shimofusensis TaxID=228596 RepID=UPI000833C6F5|nr:helix-turn-helix domain-containing protein [Nocardia shimofusensis]